MSILNKDLNTKEKFLSERHVRDLTDSDYWTIVNMDDSDLRASIIGDLLSFVLWEKEYKEPLNITFDELTKFVDTNNLDRVRQQLQHEEIKHLFTVNEGVYRLKDERQILQAAMDYCGTWYDGYDSPLASDIPFNTKPV